MAGDPDLHPLTLTKEPTTLQPLSSAIYPRESPSAGQLLPQYLYAADTKSLQPLEHNSPAAGSIWYQFCTVLSLYSSTSLQECGLYLGLGIPSITQRPLSVNPKPLVQFLQNCRRPGSPGRWSKGPDPPLGTP